MKNIKVDFSRKFLKPQGKVTRYIGASIVFLSSILSLYVYYNINYNLCIENKCSQLVITKYWVTSSGFYIIYGFSAFLTGLFIFKSKELPEIFSAAITLAVSTGFVLCGMLFFAIARELANFT